MSTNSVDDENRGLNESPQQQPSATCEIIGNPPLPSSCTDSRSNNYPIESMNPSDISIQLIAIKGKGLSSDKSFRAISQVCFKRQTSESVSTDSGALNHHHHNYNQISAGICEMPASHAMAIIGLPSPKYKVKDKQSQSSIESYDHFPIASPAKKSFTFSCGPLTQSEGYPSNELLAGDGLPSIVVASSSPSLSAHVNSTKPTANTYTKPTTLPSPPPYHPPGLFSSTSVCGSPPAPRPHSMHIPVHVENSPTKG